MKVILIITLVALSLCRENEEELDGGWEKRSLEDTQLQEKINQAFLEAYNSYSSSTNNIDLKIDDLIRLTIYTQIVSGMNYRVTFIDRKAELPVFQEYIFYNPLPANNEGKDELKLSKNNECVPSAGLLNFKDDDFTKIESKLYNILKKQNEKLNYIIYAYPIETQDYKFFIISADTGEGQFLYVLGKGLKSEDFDVFHKIK